MATSVQPSWLQSVSLSSERVHLVPLSQDHTPDLTEAVKDGNLWRLWYAAVPRPEEVPAEIQRRLDLQAKGEMLPFAVLDPATGKAIGMTTYVRLDPANRRLDIGYTWYAKSHWRTGLNTQAKYLLLKHAFEALDCIAVGFRVNPINQRSRNAVERLGAKYEGTVRNYCILPDGNISDMSYYSIIRSEWPLIQSHFQNCLLPS